MRDFDVIVIGAGPAGCATAIFMRQRGYRVALLDQAAFPRDKVCGEFISPAADPIFRELGVLGEIEALPPVRLSGVRISAYEREEVAIPYPPWEGQTARPASLSVTRKILDQILVNAARRAGAALLERHKVDDLIQRQGAVTGVRGFDPEKKAFSLSAKVVVDAGGRNCVSIRRLGLRKNTGGVGKMAAAAHWAGADLPADHCYMHVSDPGYTGMAAVGRGLINIVLVVDAALLKGQDVKSFYVQTVMKNNRRRQLLAGAGLSEEPRVVDSLAYRVRRPACGGLLLVGDAAGFIDPFTGEGIFFSLRSAQLAAQVMGEALSGSGEGHAGMLMRYENMRQQEFARKFLLSRVIQRIIYNPRRCLWVAQALNKAPGLAQALAGVIGDYYAPETVVSWRYLLKMLAAGMPFRRGKECAPEEPVLG